MFKKGSKYSRKEVGSICYPDKDAPKGGPWDTGYVRVDNLLIIFMNIGVPGKTGHDFNNYYDPESERIIWYGKPKSHSQQPLFKSLISGELTPHFFSRWDNKDPKFIYLGIGKIHSFNDGVPCLDGKGNQVTTIEIKLNIEDSTEILKDIIPKENIKINVSNKKNRSAFAKERDLENFIINNWSEVHLSEEYDLVVNPSTGKPGQNWAGSGPLDILAVKKDKSELLVIELKKGKASDEVIGQISRYMGWVKDNIATKDQKVKGLIIALEDDRNISLSLNILTDIKFLKYKRFQLEE